MADPFFVEHWSQAIANAAVSDFHRGDNDRNWVADIDWFLRPNTVAKLIEQGEPGEVAQTIPIGFVKRLVDGRESVVPEVPQSLTDEAWAECGLPVSKMGINFYDHDAGTRLQLETGCAELAAFLKDQRRLK